MLTLGRPSPDRLQAELERARGLRLTYPEVGATRDAVQGEMSAGYLRMRRRVRLGAGEEAFARASDGLLAWHMHQRAGLLVQAGAPVAVPGAEVALAVPLGPVWRLLSCRVVWTVDEPHQRGFGYGSLPGHPESGEESFVVRREADDAVVFDLAVFSRLAWWDSRLLPPASRAVQLLYTWRYLRAMRQLAAPEAGRRGRLRGR